MRPPDDARGPVDWSAAGRLAGRLAPPGPTAPTATLVALVDELRAAAARAAVEVEAISGLHPADGRPAAALSRVLVVDRSGWAAANAQVFAAMTEGLTIGSGAGASVGRVAAAGEVGSVLALLSSRVLGQFDPFVDPAGRLLLVAPNVLEVQRRLGVDAGDFRLWVCLHEQTHALQFAASPWLVEHLQARIGGLLHEVGPERLLGAGDVGELAVAAVRAVRGRDGSGILDLLSPAARQVFDEIGAVMALLEGHADVTMDQVGPAVVPTVRTIRARFEARRDAGAASTGLSGVLRRMLGMDLKLAQYRDGAAFVRGVRRRVGADGFNAVWTSPDTLPTAAEIADPAAWVARVRP